jgi:hypothetical protein
VSLFVDEKLPTNGGVLGYLRRRNERGLPLCAAPDEVGYDPYLSLGSHPDVVERVWKELGAGLPDEARCVVLGTPGLAASGLVLAVALGTSYALRLPDDEVAGALESGSVQRHRYGRFGPTLDVEKTFGPSWVFGTFDEREPSWVVAAVPAA